MSPPLSANTKRAFRLARNNSVVLNNMNATTNNVEKRKKHMQGKLVRSYGDTVICVAFDPDETLFAVAGQRGIVFLYDIESGDEAYREYAEAGGDGSIPLIRVGTEQMLGYREDVLAAMLRRNGI